MSADKSPGRQNVDMRMGLGHTKSLVKGQEREGECPQRLEQRVSDWARAGNSCREG